MAGKRQRPRRGSGPPADQPNAVERARLTYPKVTGYHFPRSRRVVSSQDFTRILRRGGCAADGTLVVFAMQQLSPAGASAATSRLGITVPKKAGTAPVRNRWKRLIREAYRTQPNAFPEGFDWIVRPKKGSQPDWRLIRDGLPRLASKAARRCQQSVGRPAGGNSRR